MLDDKKRQEVEQGLAELKETFPAYLWAMYEGSMEVGFTERQAMEIVVATIQKPWTEEPPDDG